MVPARKLPGGARAFFELFGGLFAQRLYDATNGVDREVVEMMHRTHMGNDQDAEHLLDQALRTALAQLPLAALVPEPRPLALLQGWGLSCIGDLLRLPRAGLAQRLGPALPAYLDRALGRAPDPRPDYRPPARFGARLALPAEVIAAPGLLFPARRLLLELGGFLAARGLGVQALEWRLEHESVPADRFSLGLLKPERDPALLLELLRQRLERLDLAAPVLGIELRAEQRVRLVEKQDPAALFGHVEHLTKVLFRLTDVLADHGAEIDVV